MTYSNTTYAQGLPLKKQEIHSIVAILKYTGEDKSKDKDGNIVPNNDLYIQPCRAIQTGDASFSARIWDLQLEETATRSAKPWFPSPYDLLNYKF